MQISLDFTRFGHSKLYRAKRAVVDVATGADVLPKEGETLETHRATYEIIKLLGKGGYEAVFEVKRRDALNLHFAAKCETFGMKPAVLSMDCRVLRGALQIKSPHFCSIVDRGKVPDRFRYIVMKLVGRNLWDLRMDREERRYSLSTSLKMAEQCLICIEDLHRIGYLHRDIKPDNFAIGPPESYEQQTVFMLDFGLSRKFTGEAKDEDLRLPRAIAPCRGTARYASMAALQQMEQSRKDDIEAWLYMVVEWTAGRLPWYEVKAADRAEFFAFKNAVRSGNFHDEFLKFCPKREFGRILFYVDALEYDSIPDYTFVLYCIDKAGKSNNVKPDTPLDWEPKKKYAGPGQTERDRRLALMVDETSPAPHEKDVHQKESPKTKQKHFTVTKK